MEFPGPRLVSQKTKMDKQQFFANLEHLGISDDDDVDDSKHEQHDHHLSNNDEPHGDPETPEKSNARITSDQTAVAFTATTHKRNKSSPFKAHLAQEDIETESEDEVEVAARTSQRLALTSKCNVVQSKPTPVVYELDTATESEDEVQIIKRPAVFKSLVTSKPVTKLNNTVTKNRVVASKSATTAGNSVNARSKTGRVTSRSKNAIIVPQSQPDLAKPKKATRKPKKSKDDIEMVAEEDRIFNGLTFFFIPNDDVAKHRYLRIRASIARGATWAHVYSTAVTHVLVDVSIGWIEAAKAFPGVKIPPSAVLVQDTWLAESIQWKSLPDCSQSRFRLAGAPGGPQKRPAEQCLVIDNPTKRPRRRRLAPPGTPPRLDVAQPTDELTEVIKEMRVQQDLPLDTDTFSSSSLISSFDSDHMSDSFDRENRGFQCMEKNDGKDNTANARTIEILQQMASYYDRTGDSWRTLAYRKAISALRKQDTLVSTREQALSIPQIGHRLADKIEEIVTTDRLRRLEHVESEPNDHILKLFMGIYDVGYKQASQWIGKGFESLDDLLSRAELSFNQRVGIERYDDFMQRIPRNEVAEHANIVKAALIEVDPMLEAIIGGSYRRGNEDSGDIDLLVTKKDASMDHIRTLMLDSVVPQLEASGFLKVALATGSSSRDRTCSKWHGASCLPNSTTWRRIDLLFVPWDELGAALLYFTGNDIFNRSMRLLASRKGMRLNQHGLYTDVMRGEGRRKMTDGRLLEGKSEKRIFEILGVPWRPPADRKC